MGSASTVASRPCLGRSIIASVVTITRSPTCSCSAIPVMRRNRWAKRNEVVMLAVDRWRTPLGRSASATPAGTAVFRVYGTLDMGTHPANRYVTRRYVRIPRPGVMYASGGERSI